jgi:hypothetical protein
MFNTEHLHKMGVPVVHFRSFMGGVFTIIFVAGSILLVTFLVYSFAINPYKTDQRLSLDLSTSYSYQLITPAASSLVYGGSSSTGVCASANPANDKFITSMSSTFSVQLIGMDEPSQCQSACDWANSNSLGSSSWWSTSSVSGEYTWYV